MHAWMHVCTQSSLHACYTAPAPCEQGKLTLTIQQLLSIPLEVVRTVCSFNQDGDLH